MHWHAFQYTGAYPADSEARNPAAAVRPLALSDWFSKPASMRRGTFSDPGEAHAWLAAELGDRATPERLEHYRAHLELRQDAYAGGWSAGGSSIYVRALLTCPRSGADQRAVRCPS